MYGGDLLLVPMILPENTQPLVHNVGRIASYERSSYGNADTTFPGACLNLAKLSTLPGMRHITPLPLIALAGNHVESLTASRPVCRYIRTSFVQIWIVTAIFTEIH